MKTKKKIFGIIVAILALAIATFCFAGCFSDNTSESTKNDSVTSEQPSSSDLDSTDSASGDSETGDSETSDSETSDSETGDSGSSEQPVKKQFNVTAPAASDKYTFDGTDKAVEGETYTFVVQKAVGAHGTLTVTATMGGQNATVNATDDGYEIAAVNGDIVITVTYADKLVAVTRMLCAGVNFVGEEKATVGSDYKFKIEFEAGYTAGEGFAVKVNGVTVTADAEGFYVVKGVKAGFAIEVIGAKTITYGVTYVVDGVAADAIDKTSDEILYANEKYTINFTVSAKYSQSKDDVKVFYKIGDGAEQEVLLTDGAYVITNPKADITVIVKGLKINAYKVNFVVNGDVFYSLEKVDHGTAVTEEMLEEAAAELAAQGLYEVIGWGEIPSEITGYTCVEPKVSAKSVVSDRAYDDGACAGTTFKGGVIGNWSVADDVAAPEGFKTVQKMTSGFNDGDDGKKYLHGRFLHSDVTNYSMITFALKANGIFSCDTTVGGDAVKASYNDWVVYTLTNNGGIWHINVKCGDTVISDFNDSAARTALCDILWHGRAVGFNITAPDEGELAVYSTEVRGVLDADKLGGSVVVKKVITDATETTDTVIGFEKAYHYKPQGTPADGRVEAKVADTDVTAYNYLVFYVKVTGSWILFDGWDHYFASNGQWVKVEANKTGAQQWVVKFKGGKGEMTTVNNVTTLNQLLTFEMDTRDSSLDGATVEDCTPSEITITEIRGKKGSAPSAPQGEPISDNVYGSIEGGASIATVKTGETAPAGFENVYYYKSEPKAADGEVYVHGMFFSRTDITEYSTVSFAMKTNGKYQLNDPNRVSLGNDWIVFKLEQAQDGTWTLTLTNVEGKVVHSAEKLTGTNVFEILWHNLTTSYCPVNDEETGVSLKVWTTDVRGVLRTAE